MLKRVMKRGLIGLLCLLLLSGLLPAGLAMEPGTDSFVFMAANALEILVKPEYIPVSEGQTLLQALEAAGHSFLIENGFLYAINGQAGNYTIRDNDGGYDLNAAAAGKSSLIIADNSGLDAGADALVVYMAEVYDREDRVCRYETVAAALDSALSALQGGGDYAACLTALQKAVGDYDARPVHTVAFSILNGGSEPIITLTNSSGYTTTYTDTTLSLAEDTYTFSVSDGGYNRTEGSFTVSEDCELAIRLSSAEWFSEVNILNTNKERYQSVDNRFNHRVTIYIPDTVGTNGLYLNANASGIPTGTRLRTIFVGVDGKDKSGTNRSWNSTNTAISQLLTPGMTGRTFDLEAQYTDESGYVQIQTYTVTIERIPTLRSLLVLDNGANGLSTYVAEKNSFTLDVVSDSVTIAYETFGEDYTVKVNGGDSMVVALAEGENTIEVMVSADGHANTYQILANRVSSVPVLFSVPAGSTVEVTNAAGAVVAPSEDGSYPLIAGQSYTYTSTKNEWYHTSASFTAEAGLTVTVAEPDTGDALLEFAAFDSGSKTSRSPYPSAQEFTPALHQLSYTVPDANASFYVQATCADGYTGQAIYAGQSNSASTHGTGRTVNLKYKVGAANSAMGLTYCVAQSGYGQSVLLRLSKTDNGVTYFQEYRLGIIRSGHMKSIVLTDENGEDMLLYDEAETVIRYDRDILTYVANVTDSAEKMTISGEFYSVGDTTPVCGGYRAEVNGAEADIENGVTLALNPELQEETLTVTVRHSEESTAPATYTFRIVKLKPVNITVNTDPAEARVFIINNANGKTQTNNNGTFALTPKNNYTVTVTANGYVGQSLSYKAPDENAVLEIKLEKASVNTNLTELEAQWPYFRADENNNGIVDVPTPKKAEEAVLYWANRVGEGWDTGACGCPILVDDCLYVYADNRIVKVDSLTGETLAVGEMDRTSSFAINSPTYADGMIFVGLSNGGVQAFDAVTLESLWIYNDAKKGQPNCPIYYYKGYIYTGFWNGETLYANAVCLSVTDEDPSNPKEEKLATWTYTCKGGFYWSGSYVTDNFALIPTDDGESGYTTGYATLVSINPETGNVIDILNLPDKGDARTSVCYDEVTNKYWFATKGGYVYGASVNEDGTFNKDNLSRIPLYNYANDASNPAMSTCTPAIYNGRMYVGVSGVAQFGAYSGHNITVIDLTREKIAYTVRTQGYPQTSGLVTTAYEKEEGVVYVYFFDNYTPGKLRVIRDRPGQTAPDEILVETNVEKGVTVSYDTAPILFTPDGAQAQYAICSPIADQYGTIYFKNDSGYLMAVGSTIEKMEITTMPDKTAYHIGDRFDPTGMVVTATYTNGVIRDVTKYVTFSDLPLTEEDSDFIISYEYVMYQNKDGQAGVEYTAPSQVLTLTVTEAVDIQGDINGDECLNLLDVSLLFHIYIGDTESELPAETLDVNGDGSFNLMDVAVLFRMVSETA